MNRQLVGVRVIDGDELDAGLHQRGDECEVAGQPVELRNDELGFLRPADVERDFKLRPGVVLTALDLGELPDQRPGAAVEVGAHRGLLQRGRMARIATSGSFVNRLFGCSFRPYRASSTSPPPRHRSPG